MGELSFTEFNNSESLEVRRQKLNELLLFTTQLNSTMTQFSEIYNFIKNTYNSKPFFFGSIDAISNCKFLQNGFTCVCIIMENDKTYLRYYKITNLESGTPDGDTILEIKNDSTIKAVKIPDLFGIELLIQRLETLEENAGGVTSEDGQKVGQMTGATSTTAGTSGLVPAPAAGDQESFLRGDGTWVVPTYSLDTLGVTATTSELNILDGVTATTDELNYIVGVTSDIQTQLDSKSANNHTHNYAGSSSVGGAATSANKLNTNAGNASTPVYFSNGVPVACTSLALEVTGVSESATKDSAGNVITSTYATKSEVESATSTAKSYTDTAVANLIGSADSTMDTLGEIQTAMEENADVVEALHEAIGSKASADHTHNYAGSSSVGGAATSANKLNTNAGSATQPVYFKDGVPVACTSLALEVEGVSESATKDSAGNVIVDTYETKANAITGLSVDGKVITYTKGNGTTGTIITQDTNTTYSNATTSTAGLMSASDKEKLDGIASGANNYTYTLPTASSSTLGGVKTSSTVTSTDGLTACPIISGVPYYKDTNTTYSNATTSAAGLMSASDKSKLDSLDADLYTVYGGTVDRGSSTPTYGLS